MKKGLIILWLLGILLLCVPLSYVINVNENTYFVAREFNLLVLVSALISFVILGLIALIVYFFIRKKPNAVRNTLLTFTVLVFGVTAVSVPEFGEKMKKRNAFLHKGIWKYEFLNGCKDKGKSMLSTLQGMGIDSAEVKLGNYCECMFERINADQALYEKITTSEQYDVMEDPEVKRMAQECVASELQ